MMCCFFLTGCSFIGTTKNNIVNTVIRYEDITISDFNSMTEQAVTKASQSSVAILASVQSIITSKISLGSGVIIKRVDNSSSYTYYALTNRHVVDNDNKIIKDVEIIYNGKQENSIRGKTILYDNYVDIALIEFETTILFEPATIGSSLDINKGEFVIAYGTPYSLDFFGTANFGIVSSEYRAIEDEVYGFTNRPCINYYIQHDASINSGNSGGGLFDIYGNLVGINTLKLVGDNDDIIDGIGFAIPIHKISSLVNFQEYFNK